ncbi:aminoglycoside 6-adenylyltransferase, partial [Patescibacteria group bacterium]
MTKIHKPILGTIKEVLDADTRVVACWLEGSIARGEDDDFSDIDLWIAVKERSFQDFIDDREQFAAQLGTVVSVLYPKTLGQNDAIDSFQILLEDQPASLTVDVDVQKASRKFHFTKDSAAEECEVIFDKANIIKYKAFNPQAVEEYVGDLFEDTVPRFWHRLPKVKVHLQRGDLLESVDSYKDRLDDLVTL